MPSISTYARFKNAQMGDTSVIGGSPVDYDGDTLKLIVLKDTHTPDTSATSAQQHLDDISADEVTVGSGYTGAITLTGVTYSFTGDTGNIDIDDITIPQDSGTGFSDARYAVIYKDTGAAGTSPLMHLLDFDASKTNTVQDIDLSFPDGILDIA